MQKWHRFDKHNFYALRRVDAAVLASQLVLAFRLKSEPLRRRSVPLAGATLTPTALALDGPRAVGGPARAAGW